MTLVVPAQFHDVTDDKSRSVKPNVIKKCRTTLKSLFNEFSAGNHLFIKHNPDTSVELMKARVALKSFGHIQNFYYNS